MGRGELNIDPFEREFFATEVLDTACDALVREVIQNALDAGVADDPVKIRFRLGGRDPATMRRYLEGLWPHARAALDDHPLPDPEDPGRFLVVEDFGTRGLEGDPHQYEDTGGRPDDGRNDFYYFWRNVGRSRKESLDRGRWGLGKTVLAATSELQAFLGWTRRRSDARDLLMGQAVLKIHHHEDVRFRPYGYFGVPDGELALPATEARAIARFARDFELARDREPGLSLVIPYPVAEIGRDRLVASVIRHYFHPLVTGKLAAIVEEGSHRIQLNCESLEGFLRRSGDDALRSIWPMIDLARWQTSAGPEATAELKAPPAEQAPRFDERLLGRRALSKLRRRYDAGQRIAIDATVTVQPADGDVRDGRLTLLAERTDGNRAGEGHFVRQGITVANGNARRPRNARWLMIIDDEHLSAFLGDAENPAHTEWQRSSPKFKEKYRLGPSTLDFVRALPRNVIGLLSRPSSSRDPDLLRSIFSLGDDTPITAATADRPQTGPGAELTTLESEPGTLGEGGVLKLLRQIAGFKLIGTLGPEVPRRLRVRVAYEVLRGNPFKRHDPLDFRLDQKPIALHHDGVTLVRVEANELELAVTADTFELKAIGFDANRDLRIKVEPLEGPA